MEKDGTFTGETIADPSGLNIPILYTAAPIKDNSGQVVGALEYVVPIEVVQKTELVQGAQRRADRIAAFQKHEVERIAAVMRSVADGDLTEKYQVAASDEDTASVAEAFAEVAQATNATLENLKTMIGQITESAAQFNEGSRVIAESSQSLASGAQTQSASVEEVSGGDRRTGFVDREREEQRQPGRLEWPRRPTIWPNEAARPFRNRPRPWN